MSKTVINTQRDDSTTAAYVVVLFLTLCFRPAIFYTLAEPAYILVFATVGGYFFVGKKGYITRRKALFAGLCTLFYFYIAAQSLYLGTASLGVVLKEMGFMVAPVLALLLMNHRTWDGAVKGLMTPVFILLPSYLVSTILALALGSYDLFILDRFVIDMGDGTYDAVLAFPYSLYVGGTVSYGPLDFRRATGFVREPGIYQILLIISYFAVDLLKLRYRQILKGGLLANVFLTFSTAGWGAFAASWLYFNVLSSRYSSVSGLRSFGKRIGAFVLSLPLVYYVLFAGTKASLTEKLAGASGQVRIGKAIISLQVFQENTILGAGFQSPEVPSIHFIGEIAELGLVGVFLIVLFTVFPIWSLIRRFHPVLVFVVPLILTILFAQPIFGKTLFFLILALVVGYPDYDQDLRKQTETATLDKKAP